MSRTVIDAAGNTRVEDENTGPAGKGPPNHVPTSDKAPIQDSKTDPVETKSSGNASKLLSATLSPSPGPYISVRPRSAHLKQEENLHNLTIGSRRNARPRGSNVGAHRQVSKAITEVAGFDQNVIPALKSPERKQELEQKPKGFKKGGEAKDERGKSRIFERMRERIDSIGRKERARVNEEAWKFEQEEKDRKKAKILRIEAEEDRIDSFARKAKREPLKKHGKPSKRRTGRKLRY
ncbi:hypothetical protein N431DRAFT_471593 [Stipitochalara longipes BDJ]|nr:hypothetical protein N431DRAFT_471593 [Stipitochalara longipes BDJ]